MREPLSRNSLLIATLLLLVALLAAAAAIGLYVVVFAPQADFMLSRTDVAWSNFGTYIGGVLGPLFSFLAFAGVLITVWLQAKQIDDSRQRAQLEEFQRVLAAVSTNIDGLLSLPPNSIVEFAALKGLHNTVFTVLAAAGTAELSSKPGSPVVASHDHLIRVSKEAITSQADALVIELHQLVWCLREYEREGGSASVAEFYANRYKAIVCWLDALSLVDSSLRVQEYFKPKEFRQFLIPEA